MIAPQRNPNSPVGPSRRRSPATLVVLALLAVAAFAGLFALGTWQIERRAWKHALIERVEQRVHAPAVDAPGPAQWPRVTAASDEYRHVRLRGTFLHEHETVVQAVSAYGSGFWVMTPLRQRDGSIVLVNRGFVPQDRRDPATRAGNQPSGEVTVTGLLRISEPKGGFLRSNDAAAGKWYSRDVRGIAMAAGLDPARVAPYFVDADADAGAAARPGEAPAWPVGGLTVISFPDNHLVYALTWYGLALMVAAAAWYVGREEYRLRRAR